VHGGIGGGHELFGQILEKQLQQRGIATEWFNARLDASSPFTKAYWNAVNAAYRLGAQGGRFTKAYGLIRGEAKDSIPPLKFLKETALSMAQSDIRRTQETFGGVVVSTHANTAVKTDAPLVLVQGDLYGGRDYAETP